MSSERPGTTTKGSTEMLQQAALHIRSDASAAIDASAPRIGAMEDRMRLLGLVSRTDVDTRPHRKRKFEVMVPREVPAEYQNIMLQRPSGPEQFNISDIVEEQRAIMLTTLLDDPSFGPENLFAALFMEGQQEFEGVCEAVGKNVRQVLGPILKYIPENDKGNHDLLASLRGAVEGPMTAHVETLKLKLESMKDPKTGLFTREYHEEVIRFCLEKNVPCAVMQFDMKGLGPINSALGQNLGDVLLKKFFQGAHKLMRPTDVVTPPKLVFVEGDAEGAYGDLEAGEHTTSIVGRRQAGGDEGQMVLTGVETLADLAVALDKLQKAMETPVSLAISPSDFDKMLAQYQKLNVDVTASGGSDTKAFQALKFLDEWIGQILEDREWAQNNPELGYQIVENAEIDVKLDMRLAGMIAKPGNGLNPKSIFDKMEYLENVAKAQEGLGKNTVAVVAEGEDLYAKSAEDESFRRLVSSE